ncbi:amidohydrolase [Chitinophaga silvatica]|uniref:Amidohydrolase n=1 Tax=Chitinophaga silvatica TaxID=2282649 RepID=A0A3E1Y5R5_9BACT|nr:M20 family metallopeptidase [Chitinophaga silvatica]RFS20090.1 amidohydrolase [Chitinophaga silvatica]
MKISALLLLCLIVTGSWQSRPEMPSLHEQVGIQTDEIFEKLIKIRRDFHSYPELAGKEVRTQKIIAEYLKDLGMEVDTTIYGHSVVGILHGSKPGRNVAWRSDMDALASNFPDKVDFSSKVNGVQQGCGHDIHMAIGLGIAEILAKNKESINGTMYFIFQPEEETFVGAKEMIAHGLFSKIHPDEIYGLHITPLPVGQIMVKPNEMYAYQKGVRINLKNNLSKEEGADLAKLIYNSLSRFQPNTKPWKIQHIIDPESGLINPNTIYKDYLIMDEQFRIYSEKNELFLETYLYETNQSNLQKIIPKIKRLIGETKYKNQLLSVSYTQENPTIMNAKKLTNGAINTLNQIYGPDLITPDYGQVPYFNDDFSYFQQEIPGVYFFLGGSNFGKGIIAMNHAPNFNVDEESIRVGVRSFSSLMLERLKNKR